MEGGKTVSRSTRSTFNLPPSTEAKRWHEVPPADGVRKAGDFILLRGEPPSRVPLRRAGPDVGRGRPDFSVGYGGAIELSGYCEIRVVVLNYQNEELLLFAHMFLPD